MGIFLLLSRHRKEGENPQVLKAFRALGFFMDINPISPKESNDDGKEKQEKIQTLLLHKPMEIMGKIL
jgi:hypothetical protein